MNTLNCCFIDQTTGDGCVLPAEWLILTVRRDTGDGEQAGPDPYGDDTHACTDHVGHLLDHQPDCVNPDEVYWHVAPIGWAS